ncbi:BTB/POZ and MATH domain-containing protein 2 [Brachypodium distachyon]|uniref:MATH domain-containing protein n=1 Tax=Brachypodium distachyon TaxID=15368 RepID=I1I248_BRADI|nr:BTB/POZ and MATH domain-containing protein 2 [Brachypodium distachyon]KQJ95674.1 hypothetical protein BRADI_3g18500v3 [Brachypodium distachyon]|eukprot:XP_010236481.1 BTB/POZ and MATH domain-containing protein 2 [Brachypodium distachyon]
MEEPQKPPIARTTASTCAAETARGTHAFKIAGYKLHKGLGVGNFIRSASFAVGGYRWCVRYYPDGSHRRDQGYVSIGVELQSPRSEVRALYDLWLTNPATGASSPVFSRPSSFPAFSTFKPDQNFRGSNQFMKRELLEASPYLQDDCLVIHCDLTVLKGIRVEEEETTMGMGMASEIQVPPSDSPDSFGKLVEEKKRADVVAFMRLRARFFSDLRIKNAARTRGGRERESEDR